MNAAQQAKPQSAETLEKIKKLLRLARSANPHEAELALQRAMALAAEHRIQIDGIDADAVAPKIERHDDKTLSGVSYDRQFAGIIINRFFRVRVIMCSAVRIVDGWPSAGQKISIVGDSSDLEIALHVYHFVRERFSYCWKKFRGRTRNRYSYVHGMFTGIYSKLAEQEKSVPILESNQRALVPRNLAIERYVGQNFGRLRQSKLANPTAAAASYAGYLQGRKTEIAKTIKDGTPRPLALT